MKKIHLFLSALLLLVLVFTCFAQSEKEKQQTQPPTKTEKLTRQTSSQTDKTMPVSQNPQDATLIANEKKIMDALKGKDAAAFNGLVAEDAWSVSPEGRMASREATVQGMQDLNITEFTLTEPKVKWLNKDVALVTYQAAVKGSFKGQEIPPGSVQASTVWVNRNGKWTAVFHQMTPTRSQ